MLRRVGSIGFLLALGACGGGGGGGPGDVPAPLPLRTAQQACDALASAQVPASSIALATRGAKVTSAKLVAPTTSLPEHCLIVGEIGSIDPNAEPITFTAALPSAWNQKLMHIGGAGWNGTLPDVTRDAVPNFLLTQAPAPLARGYAVFGSNSGHEARTGVNQAAFALNDEMLRNFAGEQLKKTRDAVVALMRERYPDPVRKTYFIGGSEGGREAMVAIQRYPADYAAVFSLFPVFNWLPSLFKWHQVGRALRTIGCVGWISPAKATLLNNAEVAACDALDGVADGIISNVKACAFDAATLRCPNGADTGDRCLSDAQIATTRVMYSPTSWNYDLANGVRSIPAYYPGTFFPGSLGTSAQFNVNTVVSGGGSGPIGTMQNLGDSLIRYVILRDQNADTLAFDPAAPGPYLPRIQEASALLDATTTDISAFLARGGKWIVAHGLADQLPVFAATAGYYESVAARFGQAELDKSVRFYTIAGFAHGAGPFNALNGIPALDALENWVENGVAPGTLVARDSQGRTRPMCIYPAWPRYRGAGDVNQASSFECVP
jgi:feruloyl esterase